MEVTMKRDKHIDTKRQTICIGYVLLMLCLTPASAMAQLSAISLSKNADFSTEDRDYYFDEMIYARVTASYINTQSLDKNELNLSAVSGNEWLEERFTHKGNGVFEGVLDLNTLANTGVNWEVEVRLEDRNEREIREKIQVRITDRPNTDGGDTGGDDTGVGTGGDTGGGTGGDTGGGTGGDNGGGDTGGGNTGGDTGGGNTGGDTGGGDTGGGTGGDTGGDTGVDTGDTNAENVVQIAGAIESLNANWITVSDMVFAVDARTVVKSDTDAAIPYEWLRVGAEVTVAGIRELQDGIQASEIILHLESASFFQLQQNYPNPFRESTTIQVEVFESQPAPARIVIYDTAGREVETLVDTMLSTGRYTFEWQPGQSRAVASGVYFCRVVIGGYSQTRSMILER